MMISSCLGVLETDERTDGQTFVIVELLLRLKIYHTYDHDCISEFLSPPTPPSVGTFSLLRIFMKTSQKDKIQE